MNAKEMREAYLACSLGGNAPSEATVPGDSLNTWTESDDYDPTKVYVVTKDDIVEAGE